MQALPGRHTGFLLRRLEVRGQRSEVRPRRLLLWEQSLPHQALSLHTAENICLQCELTPVETAREAESGSKEVISAEQPS